MEKLAGHTPFAAEAHGFSGLALPYGKALDGPGGPTIVERGAFAESLRRDGDRIVIVANNDETQPIGRPTELQERPDGLWVKARISATTAGKDTLQLLRDGILKEISVGIDVERESGSNLRRIRKAKLWFVSLAPWSAAGPAGARVESVFAAAPRAQTEAERANRAFQDALSYVRNMRITPSRQEDELARALLRCLGERFGGGEIQVGWFDHNLGPKDRLGWAEFQLRGPSRIYLTTGLGPFDLADLIVHEFAHILYGHAEGGDRAEAEAEAFTEALRGDARVGAIVQRVAIEPSLRAKLEAEQDRLVQQWAQLEPWYNLNR